MPTPAERAQAQALYLEEVYAKAKDTYDRNKDELSIDIQGRVLLEVALDDSAWERIYRAQYKIQDKEPIPNYEEKKFKNHFAKLLGHPITAKTSVSYDIQTPSAVQLNVQLGEKLATNLEQALRGKKKAEKLTENDRKKIDEDRGR